MHPRQMPQLLVRTDADRNRGTGHAMRCAALALRLAEDGIRCSFLVRDIQEHLATQLNASGIQVHRIPETALTFGEEADLICRIASTLNPAPILCVDHYDLDARWESPLRPAVRKILVIDDLANRPHDCDLLIDQNLHRDAPRRYDGLVPRHCKVFVGPQYALLRAEFDNLTNVPVRGEGVKKLLSFFGGSDPSKESLTFVRALRLVDAPLPEVTVVLGPANPIVDDCLRAASGLREIEILETTTEMAKLMTAADLSVGTCGVAAWERCAVGLPALVVVTADNQREDAELLEELGIVECLGEGGSVSPDYWAERIQALISDPDRLARMSAAAFSLGRGRSAAWQELRGSILDGITG